MQHKLRRPLTIVALADPRHQKRKVRLGPEVSALKAPSVRESEALRALVDESRD